MRVAGRWRGGDLRRSALDILSGKRREVVSIGALSKKSYSSRNEAKGRRDCVQIGMKKPYTLQIPIFSKFLYSPNSSILQIPLFSKFLYSPNSFILSIPLFSQFLYSLTTSFSDRPPPLPSPHHHFRHPTSSSAQTAVPQHARSLRTAGKRMAGPWDPARGPLDRTRVQSSTHPRPRRRSRLLSAEDGGDAC